MRPIHNYFTLSKVHFKSFLIWVERQRALVLKHTTYIKTFIIETQDHMVRFVFTDTSYSITTKKLVKLSKIGME